jgi:hypothetical protein
MFPLVTTSFPCSASPAGGTHCKGKSLPCRALRAVPQADKPTLAVHRNLQVCRRATR